MKAAHTLRDRIDQAVFNAIYARSLVYNTCWEDPAVDRLALDLCPDDTLLVITSAGCNVLDYALRGTPTHPRGGRQSAPDGAAGTQAGRHPPPGLRGLLRPVRRRGPCALPEVYHDALRPELSDFARGYWDERLHWFSRRQGSFYFQGLAGTVARAFRAYLNVRPRLAASVGALFEADSLDGSARASTTPGSNP